MVAIWKELAARLKSEMISQLALHVTSWQEQHLGDLSTVGIEHFGKEFTSKRSTFLTKWMKAASTTIEEVKSKCHALGTNADDITGGLFHELQGHSRSGLQVFTMGTAYKLLSSRDADKASRNASSTAYHPETFCLVCVCVGCFHQS